MKRNLGRFLFVVIAWSALCALPFSAWGERSAPCALHRSPPTLNIICKAPSHAPEVKKTADQYQGRRQYGHEQHRAGRSFSKKRPAEPIDHTDHGIEGIDGLPFFRHERT